MSSPEEIFACACVRVCVHVTTSLKDLAVAPTGRVNGEALSGGGRMPAEWQGEVTRKQRHSDRRSAWPRKRANLNRNVNLEKKNHFYVSDKTALLLTKLTEPSESTSPGSTAQFHHHRGHHHRGISHSHHKAQTCSCDPCMFP